MADPRPASRAHYRADKIAAEAGTAQFRPGSQLCGSVFRPGDALELPLLDSLERELRKMTGVTIDREAWQWDQVPDHLKITFRVVDDKNKKLQEGRSLQALKDALKGKVQETLSAVG